MKFRLTCFASHVVISAIIAALSVLLVFKVWYPAPLHSALGVADIFILLLCVDVVLGPLLTLVVAKKGKKTLKTDLLAIAALQLTALFYGLYVVAEGRPVWLVYDAGRFEVVLAHEAISQHQPQTGSRINTGFTGPVWLTTGNTAPVLFGRGDEFLNGDNLQPLTNAITEQAIAQAMPLAVLERINTPQQVMDVLQHYPNADAFIPMVAKERPLVVLVNKQTRELIAIADLLPW